MPSGLGPRLRTRRDHKRFLCLIEAAAFLHQFQRPGGLLSSPDGTPYIEAGLADYRLAYELARQVLRAAGHVPRDSSRARSSTEHVLGDGLRRANGGWLALDQTATQALTTYLRAARPRLAGPASGQALMLGCVGGGRLGGQAVQVRLRALGRRAGLETNLTPRWLRQSVRELDDAFARPRLPLIS